MTKTDSTNGDHRPDDNRGESKDRIDANPPYGADKVMRFRRLLAELIVRRIAAARRRPPDAGEPPMR